MPPQFQTHFDPANKLPNSENSFAQKPPRSHFFLITLTLLMLLSGGFATWFFLNPAPEENFEEVALTKRNETADWKTYRNEEYGFEFKYPKELILQEYSDKNYPVASLNFPGDDMGGKSININIETGTLNLAEKDLNSQGRFISKEKIITVNSEFDLFVNQEILQEGIPKNAGLIFVTALTQKDNIIYSFGTIGPGSLNILKEVLSTFKFISTSTSQTTMEKDHSDLSLGLSRASQGNISLLITGPSGKQTGFNLVTQKTIENIPSSVYFTDCLADDVTEEPAATCVTTLNVNQPMEGKYTLLITGSGDYQLSIRAFAKDGSSEPPITKEGTAVSGATEKFIISFIKSPGGITTIRKF